MNALDQALIRAFGKEPPIVNATMPPAKQASGLGTSLCSTTLVSAEATSLPFVYTVEGGPVRFDPSASVQLSGPDTVVPAPHVHMSAALAAAAGAMCGSAERAERKAAGKTAETARRENANRSNKPAVSRERLKMHWEVDRFRWPDVVNRLVADCPEQRFAAIGRCLTDAMRRGVRRVAVTSLDAGAGCTTVALCLARAMAGRSQTLALVDANLDAPAIARKLGVRLEFGWERVLRGDADVEESAIVSIDDAMTLLPLMDATPEEKLSRQARRAAQALKRLSDCHDLVLMDVGPVMSDKAPVFVSAEGPAPIEGAIVVCDRRATSSLHLGEAIERLQSAGIETLGVVENYVSGAGAEDAPIPNGKQPTENGAAHV